MTFNKKNILWDLFSTKHKNNSIAFSSLPSKDIDNMSQDTTNSFSKMSLNPAASEWKPNFGAKAFVPSFGAPAAAAAAPAPAPVAPAAAAAPGKLTHYNTPSDHEGRGLLQLSRLMLLFF